MFQGFAKTLQHFFNNTTLNHGHDASAKNNFLLGIATPLAGVVSYGIIVLSNIASLVKEPRKWFFIVLPAFIVKIYLIFTIAHGSAYVTKYYSAWFIVLLLPFFVLPEIRNTKIILFSIFTLFLIILYPTYYYHPLVFFQKQNSDLTRQTIKVHDILKKKLTISKTNKTKTPLIVYDHRVVFPYTTLDGLNLNLVGTFDNIAQSKFGQAPDYIITHSEGIEQMTESDFEKRVALASPEMAKIYRNTRKELLRLINKRKFRGDSFKKEIIENVYLFTRVHPAI